MGVDVQQGDAAAAAAAVAVTEPRRGSRRRQPTRKAEEQTVIEAEIRGPRGKGGAATAGSHEGVTSATETAPADVDASQEEEEGEGNASAEGEPEENAEYCVCRGQDDGTPMVECAQCNDWFHLRCIGLTKKAAEKLDEYVCAKCSEGTGPASETIVEPVPPVPTEEEAKSPGTNKRKASSRTASDSNKKSRPALTATKKSDEARQASSSEVKSTKEMSKDDQQSDVVRSHAVKHLTSILTPIFETRSQNSSESSVTVHAHAAASRAFAEALEKGVFEAFAESAPGRPTLRTAQKFYKDRFRTLSFSLRDRSNEALRARIAGGELSADVLATLPSEQLANDAIRARTEKAREEALRQSVLKQQEAGPLRKMTHKGEVDIEHEHAAPLADSFNSRTHRPQSPVADASPRPKTRDEDDVTRDSSKVHQRSTVAQSAQQSSPKTPSTAGQDTEADAITAAQANSDGQRAVQSASLQSPKQSTFDFSNVWQPGQTPASPNSHDVELTAGEAEDDNAGDNVERKKADDADVGDQGYEAAKASDDFIDNFLQGISTAGNADEPLPSSTASILPPAADDVPSTTPRGSPPPNNSAIFWTGAVAMPDEATISGNVRQVGGRRIVPSHDSVHSFFPSVVSVLEGRLPSKVASDYLLQSRIASRTELVVFALEKSYEPEILAKAPAPAPTSADALDASFDQLLNYLQRRQRYGVLLPSASARDRKVKDFYIAPLPKDSPLPEWLELLGSIPFLGQEQCRDRDLMLLVAVVFKGAFVSDNATPPSQGNANDRSAEAQTGSTSHSAAALFDSNGTGSSALQDLLRAVGGGPEGSPVAKGEGFEASSDPRRGQSGASEGTAATAAVASSSQQSGVATVLDALRENPPAAESKTTAAALSEVPQADITKVLTGNPDLLSQLLKTLGGGDSNNGGHAEVASALHNISAPPPGLPPGPPPRPPAHGLPGPPPGPPPVPSPIAPRGPAPSWNRAAPVPPTSSWPGQGGPEGPPTYGGPTPYGMSTMGSAPPGRHGAGGPNSSAGAGPGPAYGPNGLPPGTGWGARGGGPRRR
ncbi:unnamed protein product [Parajaminaea phylloscopi]